MGNPDYIPAHRGSADLYNMKIPPFTLVHERSNESNKQLQNWLGARLDAIRSREPALADSLQKRSANLARALLSTSFAEQVDPTADDTHFSALKKVVADLERQPKVVTVGVWDLGARVGWLSRIVEVLNAAQGAFAIFQLEAAIPADIISRPERIAAWIREKTGKAPGPKARKGIANSTIEDDFYKRAGVVRKDLGLDYLVGITPTMIAGEDVNREVNWDYFSSSRGRLILASTYELRRFALKAGRPFEVAVGALITAQLLVAVNPRLDYHSENRKCLFDYNDDRVSIVDALKTLGIEDECLRKIRPEYREVARDLVEALKVYRGKED